MSGSTVTAVQRRRHGMKTESDHALAHEKFFRRQGAHRKQRKTFALAMIVISILVEPSALVHTTADR